MNEHYIKNKNEADLFDQFINYCALFKGEIKSDKKDMIKKSLNFLKNKAKTLEDIFNNSKYIILEEINFDKDDLKLIDEKGTFEADDEVGFFFLELKEIGKLLDELFEEVDDAPIKEEEKKEE